jgi:protease-4
MADAIAKAAQLAKLGDERTVRYLEPSKGFREQFLESLAADSDETTTSDDAFALFTERPRQQLAAALAEVRAMLSGPAIQVRCLECPASAPARREAHDTTVLELLREWLS